MNTIEEKTVAIAARIIYKAEEIFDDKLSSAEYADLRIFIQDEIIRAKQQTALFATSEILDVLKLHG